MSRRVDDGSAGVPGADQAAERQHVADHGAPAVDVGRAQALVGAEAGELVDFGDKAEAIEIVTVEEAA